MTGSFWNYYRDEMNDDANKRGIKWMGMLSETKEENTNKFAVKGDLKTPVRICYSSWT